MIPALEEAASLAEQASGALHSAAVQPTPATVLARIHADLQRAVEIVAGALPAELVPAPEVATVAAKPKRARK